MYKGLVWGRLQNDQGVIDRPISIKDGSVKRTVFKGKMTRPAKTEYRVLRRLEFKGQPLTLLEVTPKTGRTHQIRVHLSSVSHPVVGDALYGKSRSLPGLPRHFLHAAAIELPLPSGGRIKIQSDLPEELEAVLRGSQDYHPEK